MMCDREEYTLHMETTVISIYITQINSWNMPLSLCNYWGLHITQGKCLNLHLTLGKCREHKGLSRVKIMESLKKYALSLLGVLKDKLRNLDKKNMNK